MLGWIFTGRPPAPEAEVIGELPIGSVEAERGTLRRITVPAGRTCARCGGRGRVVSEQAPGCPACGGEGRRKIESHAAGARLLRVELCDACEGKGRLAAEACGECNGDGRAPDGREVSVFVPPGVRDGQELVVDRLVEPDGRARNLCVRIRLPSARPGNRIAQLLAAAFVALAVLAVVALLVSS